MKNKVVYCSWRDKDKVAKELGDCYILTSNNWDDYGYQTSFDGYIYKNQEKYEDFDIKILFKNKFTFEDELTSATILNELLESSREEFIKFSEIQQEFISLGNKYEELVKIFPDTFEEILEALNDTIYLEKREPENKLLALKGSQGFRDSLCRDQSAKKVLAEAKYTLYGGEEQDIERFQFDFNFKLSDRQYEYNFNFVDNDLPNRINILVGKNGSGKSQTLLALCHYFLDKKDTIAEFDIEVYSEPNFIENTMLFAYNPQENFPIDKRKDYKYLGFRRYKTRKDILIDDFINIPNGFEILQCIYGNDNVFDSISFESMSDADIIIKEILSLCNHFSEENVKDVCFKINNIKKEIIIDNKNLIESTFNSFEKIYNKDRNNYAHEIKLSDIPYRNKIIEFLNNAFECDGIGLKFIGKDIQQYQNQSFEFIEDKLILRSEKNDENFVKDINFEDFDKKLYFFNKDEELYLSTGQQTFVDLVINLLSLIKINSLILIDEPENTLHPNLEIDFMKILQNILEEFDSFAIIATHSSIVVREVPSEYVRVIKIDEDNQPDIEYPNISTFGADIRKITNYIFDDIFIEDKPFEMWIEEQKKAITFEEFQEKFKDKLDYDFLNYCYNFWAE